MKLTSTNKPITCHNSYVVLASTMRFPRDDRDWLVLDRQLDSVSAAIATGKRPAPFRTRKLSPSAPMVLPGRPGGRVGRRRTSLLGGGHPPLHASREGLGADDRHRLLARPRSGGCAFRAMVL